MAVGTKLGRYELLARIATGGMGEIFLARMAGAAGFEKLCVIKRILPHLADDGRFRSMLIGEARIASSMSHANICHVYALEETDHQLYMVMEYLEGATLLQLLRLASRRRQQLAFGFIAGVIQQACEGLHYAHELQGRGGESLGVVHRDVTPSNLFLTETGVVKLVDFGIAKVHDAAHTEVGEVKGKYAYMAPEQLRSQAVDRRADVFSLAVVAYEMLTCRRLFQRKTDYLTFRALLDQPLPDLREHRADAPPAVSAVLQRALERDPDARCATVRELGVELLDALAVRPWTQREISDLVRTEFAHELRVHNAEVSKVLRRPDRDRPHTIPLVVPARAEGDAVDAFALDTDPSARPVRGSEGSFAKQSGIRPAAASHSQSLGARVSAPSTLPPPIEPAVVPRARPSAAPIVAVLGGAAAALAVGLVLVGRIPRHTAPPAAAPVAPPVAAAPPRERYHRAVNEPYGLALQDREAALDQCAAAHADALPPDARATLVVGLDGHPRQIALQPASAERSELGRCIRGALQLVAFPAASDEKQLALGLALRR
jgi:serine/threonine-protein kinase